MVALTASHPQQKVYISRVSSPDEKLDRNQQFCLRYRGLKICFSYELEQKQTLSNIFRKGNYEETSVFWSERSTFEFMTLATGNDSRNYPEHLKTPTVNFVKINISLQDMLTLMHLLILTKRKQTCCQMCWLVLDRHKWKRWEGGRRFDIRGVT